MMPSQPVFKDALVFTGGGTGGHFFPAVALAEGARKRWSGLPIAFVGAVRGIEAKRLPESCWPHLLLDVEGFLGRSPLAISRALWKLWQARRTLLALWTRERPKAVVATGGYGSGPAVLAAKALGIPYFLHESNAQPGVLVKRSSRGARRVWCGMEAVKERLPGADCLMVGTPIRADFLREFLPADRLTPPYRLLVLGGSGGALALNEAMMQAAPELLARFPDWEILHQTGARDFPALEHRERHARHRIQAFLEEVHLEMEAASLVISRSGASTCAELKACGRPALLVPMPGSAGDHQTMNALAMVAEGRAVHLAQAGQLPSALVEAASKLMGDASARAGFAPAVPNQAVVLCLADLEAVLH
ncbi:MAG TPA: UDP-N-acetylglucosamine--N-acetylmuramyl-(pentapeptide) pyrophosphoryl-undecaprenol N-acetylglucosamine transferase [Holophaga sp.]|nr:UDP-N-acetylglucosamine--N-acetylmuramyl-(pentapeptide) pyrophosphoryl-undecaprenol N-acetylglucosamine transferase [Holophaga sp.]HPS68584.1 UDP-N-acetylglucosamine--N-acetylmuramyl-(pentapeptide) pyrophosphoryl-undecaprenol N-acetylglucosamine transferase [Holophaga sp.]